MTSTQRVVALINIREDIQKIEGGADPQGKHPLHLAPHTLADLTAEEWDRPYPRHTAAFPFGQAPAADKYWPPVNRIDHAAGDRNLVCACPPMESYMDEAA